MTYLVDLGHVLHVLQRLTEVLERKVILGVRTVHGARGAWHKFSVRQPTFCRGHEWPLSRWRQSGAVGCSAAFERYWSQPAHFNQSKAKPCRCLTELGPARTVQGTVSIRWRYHMVTPRRHVCESLVRGY